VLERLPAASHLRTNDSAALLAPLAAASPHLSKDHPHIADRISEIGTLTGTPVFQEVKPAQSTKKGDGRARSYS
jgi:hypothetical protein